MPATMHVFRSEDHPQGSVLSLHCVGPGDTTEVVRLGSKQASLPTEPSYQPQVPRLSSKKSIKRLSNFLQTTFLKICLGISIHASLKWITRTY